MQLGQKRWWPHGTRASRCHAVLLSTPRRLVFHQTLHSKLSRCGIDSTSVCYYANDIRILLRDFQSIHSAISIASLSLLFLLPRFPLPRFPLPRIQRPPISTNRKSTTRFLTRTLPLSPPKGGSKREFLHFTLPFISSLQVIVDTSNLVWRLIIASPILRTTNCPWNGPGHVTWSTLNFKALNIPQE